MPHCWNPKSSTNPKQRGAQLRLTAGTSKSAANPERSRAFLPEPQYQNLQQSPSGAMELCLPVERSYDTCTWGRDLYLRGIGTTGAKPTDPLCTTAQHPQCNGAAQHPHCDGAAHHPCCNGAPNTTLSFCIPSHKSRKSQNSCCRYRN